MTAVITSPMLDAIERVTLVHKVFDEGGPVIVTWERHNPTDAGVPNSDGWFPTQWVETHPERRIDDRSDLDPLGSSRNCGFHLCADSAELLDEVIYGRCINLGGKLTFVRYECQPRLFAAFAESSANPVTHDCSSIGSVRASDVAHPVTSAPSSSLGVAKPGGA